MRYLTKMSGIRIGYDAKRIFFNQSGLGNYSRSLVNMMSHYYKDDTYLLFSPEEENRTGFVIRKNMNVVYPESFFSKRMPSLWRSYKQAHSIRKYDIDIYHGLSNELPYDIRQSGVRSVVTLHDLIFVRRPELYSPVDRWMYAQKYWKSCLNADRIIAISMQTKSDLVNMWNIPEEKIDVVYQGCNPIFYHKQTEDIRAEIRQKYNLPERYILSVGVIEKRKNLLFTVEAMVKGNIDVDLVVVGQPTPYLDIIKKYAASHGILNRLHFVHNVASSELPSFYQMAKLLVYTSLYEGFGIPILEGLESNTPVITSQGGVFSETAGEAALYVNLQQVGSLIEAIRQVMNNTIVKNEMIRKGKQHAAGFREEIVASNIRKVYEKLR